ncbi:unnamed protein product, partial [Phaeothamnion confervicola]
QDGEAAKAAAKAAVTALSAGPAAAAVTASGRDSPPGWAKPSRMSAAGGPLRHQDDSAGAGSCSGSGGGKGSGDGDRSVLQKSKSLFGLKFASSGKGIPSTAPVSELQNACQHRMPPPSTSRMADRTPESRASPSWFVSPTPSDWSAMSESTMATPTETEAVAVAVVRGADLKKRGSFGIFGGGKDAAEARRPVVPALAAAVAVPAASGSDGKPPASKPKGGLGLMRPFGRRGSTGDVVRAAAMSE